MAFHRFCKAALQRETLTVFGDGQQTRDFTFVSDIVAATVAAGEARTEDEHLFNIGGGSPTSLRDAIDLIGAVSGSPLDVQYATPEHGDVRDTAADTRRARETLGFAPRISLEQGLAEEFAWLAAM
jgi:UDP-glucose 4-epimerase